MNVKRPSQTAGFAYLALSFLILVVLLPVRAHFGETNLPPLKAGVRFIANLLFLNLAWAFYLTARKVGETGRIRAREWAFFWVPALVLCTMPPIFGGDLMEYLMRGRILGIYHHSPYRHVPMEFPADPFYAFCIWRKIPETYGPLWSYLEGLAALPFKASVAGTIFSQKLVLAAFMLLGIYFFKKLVSALGWNSEGSLVGLFALNPLVWISSILDGHNDVVMVALTIAAVYFLVTDRFTRAFLIFTAAFLMKYTVILILPFLIVFAVRREMARKGRFPWTFVFLQAVYNVAFMVVAFFPLWAGPEKTFEALTNTRTWFHTNTIPYAVQQALGLLGVHARPVGLKRVFLGAYGAAYLYFLYSELTDKRFNALRWVRRLCLVYLFFYLTITIPFNFHYLQWALPWLILSHWPMSEFLVTLYSFTGLFSYFKRMNYLILLACPLYFVVLRFYGSGRGKASS